MKHTNLKHLKELADGSNEFIIEMISLFIEDMPGDLEKMEIYLRNKDWQALRKVAHKIKPSIMYVGLTEIESLVKETEDYAANEKNLDELPEMLMKIKQICNEAISELIIDIKQFS